jgi:general secretion pathway protein G
MKLLRGFTLIELMATLSIMAVLAMVTVPLAQLATQRAKESELRNALMQIREAIDAYKRASDLGHIAVEVGASGYPPRLSDLVDGVVDQKSPNGRKLYFLRSLPPDPMADSAHERSSGGWGLRSYTSSAQDPKPGEDVYDVYTTSLGIGLNGVPYRQW